jgi:hypothetical protein
MRTSLQNTCHCPSSCHERRTMAFTFPHLRACARTKRRVKKVKSPTNYPFSFSEGPTFRESSLSANHSAQIRVAIQPRQRPFDQQSEPSLFTSFRFMQSAIGNTTHTNFSIVEQKSCLLRGFTEARRLSPVQRIGRLDRSCGLDLDPAPVAAG